MNRKTLTIIIIAGLIFLIFIIVIFSLLRQKTNTAATTETPVTQNNLTPTLILTDNGTYITPVLTGVDALKVVKVTPADKTIGVSTETTLLIQFNKPVKEDAIIFTIAPNTPFTLTTESNVLKVTFNKSLTRSTIYTYKVDPKETFPHTYSFTTEGPTPAVKPDTFPQGAAQIEDDFNKTNNPDIYVATRCPHTEASFSIDKNYNEGTRKFEFIVTVRGDDKKKASDDVNQWFTSIGLSYDAVSTLKVTYQ